MPFDHVVVPVLRCEREARSPKVGLPAIPLPPLPVVSARFVVQLDVPVIIVDAPTRGGLDDLLDPA